MEHTANTRNTERKRQAPRVQGTQKPKKTSPGRLGLGNWTTHIQRAQPTLCRPNIALAICKQVSPLVLLWGAGTLLRVPLHLKHCEPKHCCSPDQTKHIGELFKQ
jgi:hypothetical protein